MSSIENEVKREWVDGSRSLHQNDATSGQNRSSTHKLPGKVKDSAIGLEDDYFVWTSDGVKIGTLCILYVGIRIPYVVEY